MNTKVAKLISVITVVPIVAAFAITWIYFNNYGGDFNFTWYTLCIVFLTLLPISAYPIQKLIPSLRKGGRKLQRKLAFILAVCGYILGTMCCIILKPPKDAVFIFLAYLFSGVVLSIFNGLLKIKASGHACGISGPFTLLLYLIGNDAWWFVIVIPLVFWSRLKLKRHTYKELVLGTIVGIFSTLFAIATTLYVFA